ncbi:MAG: SPOR domain-containing protein [Deltaproteobacteria bacterium]|jgi:hypothetical protein|nr:SPOR domain-containing protein [Deltaproteobacteria bacterium]
MSQNYSHLKPQTTAGRGETSRPAVGEEARLNAVKMVDRLLSSEATFFDHYRLKSLGNLTDEQVKLAGTDKVFRAAPLIPASLSAKNRAQALNQKFINIETPQPTQTVPKTEKEAKNKPSLQSLEKEAVAVKVLEAKGEEPRWLHPIKWLTKLTLSLAFIVWVFILGFLIGRGTISEYLPSLSNSNESLKTPDQAENEKALEINLAQNNALNPDPLSQGPAVNPYPLGPTLDLNSLLSPEAPLGLNLGPLPQPQSTVSNQPKREALAGQTNETTMLSLPAAPANTTTEGIEGAPPPAAGAEAQANNTRPITNTRTLSSAKAENSTAPPTRFTSSASRQTIAASLPVLDYSQPSPPMVSTTLSVTPSSPTVTITPVSAAAKARQPQASSSPSAAITPSTTTAPAAVSAPLTPPKVNSSDDDTLYWPAKPPQQGSYTIQIGSAKEEGQAKQTVQKYLNKGFEAYFYKTKAGRYNIRIGRYPTMSEAESAKAEVISAGASSPYVSKLN